jgi:hypothetical protein
MADRTDARFKDKEAASIKATKFPAHFSERVDLRKVNISVLRPWIAKRLIELMRVEDDVVVEYVYSMIEDKDKPVSVASNKRAEQVRREGVRPGGDEAQGVSALRGRG